MKKIEKIIMMFLVAFIVAFSSVIFAGCGDGKSDNDKVRNYDDKFFVDTAEEFLSSTHTLIIDNFTIKQNVEVWNNETSGYEVIGTQKIDVLDTKLVVTFDENNKLCFYFDTNVKATYDLNNELVDSQVIENKIKIAIKDDKIYILVTEQPNAITSGDVISGDANWEFEVEDPETMWVVSDLDMFIMQIISETYEDELPFMGDIQSIIETILANTYSTLSGIVTPENVGMYCDMIANSFADVQNTKDGVQVSLNMSTVENFYNEVKELTVRQFIEKFLGEGEIENLEVEIISYILNGNTFGDLLDDLKSMGIDVVAIINAVNEISNNMLEEYIKSMIGEDITINECIESVKTQKINEFIANLIPDEEGMEVIKSLIVPEIGKVQESITALKTLIDAIIKPILDDTNCIDYIAELFKIEGSDIDGSSTSMSSGDVLRGIIEENCKTYKDLMNTTFTFNDKGEISNISFNLNKIENINDVECELSISIKKGNLCEDEFNAFISELQTKYDDKKLQDSQFEAFLIDAGFKLVKDENGNLVSASISASSEKINDYNAIGGVEPIVSLEYTICFDKSASIYRVFCGEYDSVSNILSGFITIDGDIIVGIPSIYMYSYYNGDVCELIMFSTFYNYTFDLLDCMDLADIRLYQVSTFDVSNYEHEAEYSEESDAMYTVTCKKCGHKKTYIHNQVA